MRHNLKIAATSRDDHGDDNGDHEPLIRGPSEINRKSSEGFCSRTMHYTPSRRVAINTLTVPPPMAVCLEVALISGKRAKVAAEPDWHLEQERGLKG